MRQTELEAATFQCLEGCGFCCTFPPEVASDELARLRTRRPSLPIVRAQGVTRLALQGGCGGCTLLLRRQCTAYEERPRHCRYFPFHVYFGRRTEVYVDRSCRGVATVVDPAPGGPAQARAAAPLPLASRPPLVPARSAGDAFRDQVLANAPAGAVAAHEAQAAAVHAEFERKARAAGAWADVDAAVAEAIRLVRFDEPPAPQRWADALAPFALAKVVARPFYLDDRLRWLTFRREGLRLEVLEMQEDGSLTPEGTELRPAPATLAPGVAHGLRDVILRLASRDVMAGQAFDLVDGSGYRLSVARAARQRIDQVAADLAVRVQVLDALRVPEQRIAAEAERFYDAAFLDAPTIGGWL